MAGFKVAAEDGFIALGHFVFRHRIMAIVAVALLTAGFVSQLPKIAIDTSTEGFFHPDDPAKVAYDAFREQFGRDDLVVVALHPPEVFELGFLRQLKALHEALEKGVPHLKEVNSLINARNTRGEGDQLIVEDLLAELPATPQAMATLKQRVLASPLYSNLLISEDGRYTTLVLETRAFSTGNDTGDVLAGFDQDDQAGAAAGGAPRGTPLSNEESAAVVAAVKKIAAEFETPQLEVFVAGSPVWTAFLLHAMPRDMGRFMGLAVLAIGLFLFLLFRRVSGVVLPLLVVVLSLVCTIGLMAATGTKLTSPTSILPSFLLAVGVGASVHLLSIFFGHFQQHDNKEEGIAFSLGHSGLPILMTGLTTAAGLFSFATADLVPVADLGIFGGIGVLLSLVVTLVLVPALIAVWPLAEKPFFAGRGGGGGMGAVLLRIAEFSTGHPWGVVIGGTVVVAVATAGLPLLVFSHQPTKWIPAGEPLSRSIQVIDRELKGASSLEVLIDTGKENGLYEPALLEKIDALSRFAMEFRGRDGNPLVGKTSSLADVVRETNKALHGNDPNSYAVPKHRELIAQELLLFENSGSDDLERVVDSKFSTARLTLKVPELDARSYVDFVREIEGAGKRIFSGGESVVVTGFLKLATGVFDNMITSMVKSYLIAFGVIAVLMMLLLGNIRMGLLSMVPNLLPIAMTLGIMGWVGIPLDAFTMLIGGIALGLAVDDTIHLFHNIRRNFGETGDMGRAVRESMLTTGRAILITSLVLVTGFWLFMFASLNNVFNFGLLTGLALLIALLGVLLLAPAMMMLLVRTAYGRKIAENWSGRDPAPAAGGPRPADQPA